MFTRIPSHKRMEESQNSTKYAVKTKKKFQEILMRGEEEKGAGRVSFKSKDQMRPVFPPGMESERARSLWHCTNNKWMQGLKNKKDQILCAVRRVV